MLIKLVHMIVVQFSMSFVIRLLFVSSLFIISHPLAFVKRFFKLFSSFFAVPFGFAFPLVGSLYIISQPLPFVKGFFKLFSSFLRFLFGSLRSLVDSLYIISQPVHFVKSFFKLFSSFFRFRFAFPLPFGQLVYYITSFLDCQYLFESFFSFIQHRQPIPHFPSEHQTNLPIPSNTSKFINPHPYLRENIPLST